MRIEQDTQTAASTSMVAPLSNGIMAMIQPRKPPTKKEEEMVKLMIQTMNYLGYSHAAKTLEAESGEILEPTHVSSFKQGILNGDWGLVESMLVSLDISEEKSMMVRYLISKQKYLELLFRNRAVEALRVLRNELTHMNVSESQIKNLSFYLMMPDPIDELRKQSWDGPEGSSRHDLLVEIQGLISSAIMIPEKRMYTLIDQALEWQKHNCLYHNTIEDEMSLFADHQCDKNRFPLETSQVLEEHTDEVWFISFSQDGKYLASASKDATSIIWRLDDFKPLHILTGHSEAISFVCWSPNDRHLLTASNDNSLKLWDVQAGVCKQTFAKHTDVVTSCAWLPKGDQFVSGSTDKCIYLWNIDGNVVFKWTGIRVHDLAITRNGTMMIAIAEKKIRLFDLEERHEMAQLQETDLITSIYLADGDRYALVNLCTQEIHLWDLIEKRFIRKYVGQKQGRFVIRSCFGGVGKNFIMSGSEDSNIYVWHRQHGHLLETLQGHSGCVNCVAWNPHKNAFASASDDNTIRYWSSN